MTCASGYRVVSGDTTASVICEECSEINCAECNDNPNTCTDCIDGYDLDSNTAECTETSGGGGSGGSGSGSETSA